MTSHGQHPGASDTRAQPPSPTSAELGADPEAVAWLDEPEQRAWRAWLRAYRLLMASMEEGLVGSGLRLGEYEVLAMLSEAPGRRMRMSALADKVVQSRSRLTHTATRLEVLGLVQRQPVARDGRGVEVAVTAAGHALVQQVAPVHLRTVRDCFLDQMSRDELLDLGQLMRRIIQASRERPEQGSDAF